MTRVRAALVALALFLGLAGTAACSDSDGAYPDGAYPAPASYTVSYQGAMYCGYIYDPHEVDFYGQALTCQRVIFPNAASTIVAGTLAWAMLDYLETYDSFYHSGYYYDTYYAPVGARYHVTLVQRTTFISNAKTFETRYGRDINSRSAKARWSNNRTGNYTFPKTNSKAAARNKPLGNTGGYSGSSGGSTSIRDSRPPRRSGYTGTSTRSGSTTGKSGSGGGRRR